MVWIILTILKLKVHAQMKCHRQDFFHLAFILAPLRSFLGRKYFKVAALNFEVCLVTFASNSHLSFFP
ncbi:hypothetical protein RchiOBHm_Chr3g0477301 [Rosa chinensis]|uniref:Uncharacterized protein n=1 Tax=Rosa chinensis TaxID=74649 RepID=A0A2P6RCV9_ROSCH|nr:hypothetical protein RchiOBHm_Chr3g0477301 [Rosa chinensis]